MLLSVTMPKVSNSFVNPISSKPLSPHVAVGVENMCMSRHWKSELVAYGIRLHPLPRFTHLLSLKPDRSSFRPVCLESAEYLILTSKPHSYQTVHPIRPYE
jgi:hypothetical protein